LIGPEYPPGVSGRRQSWYTPGFGSRGRWPRRCRPVIKPLSSSRSALKFLSRPPITAEIFNCRPTAIAMPKYDYLCEANGQTVEVSHPMSERLSTWGEVCERTERELGGVSAETPVRKLITGGGVVNASALKNPEAPPCQTGAPCCGANRCGFN
jgi:hypothetical protein